MVSKVAFLVLLGITLTLANPAQQVNNTQLVERSIEDAWKKLENKFSKAIDQIKATWEKVKAKGQEVVSTNLKSIKEKGLKLIQDAKDVYKQVLVEGKEASPKLKEISESLKGLAADLKTTGSEAYQDAKQLVQEVVDAVKEKLASLKQKSN